MTILKQSYFKIKFILISFIFLFTAILNFSCSNRNIEEESYFHPYTLVKMDSQIELNFAKQVDLYFKDSFYRFDSLLKNYPLDSIFFNAYFYFRDDKIDFSLVPTISLNPDDKFGSMPVAGVVLVNNRKVIIKSESARIASLIHNTGKAITLPYLLWYEEELLDDDSPDPSLVAKFPAGVPLIPVSKVSDTFWRLHTERNECEVIVSAD